MASADLAQTKGDDDPIAIVDWGGRGHGFFGLRQEKDKLLVLLAKGWGDPNPRVFEMATLPDTKPHHPIVSIDAWREAPGDKRLAFYLDGNAVGDD